ncbi:MAG: LptF/LptG family permease [candidate division Zixibacteria bacterium]|nr:LptF/LptG family permease [candidate division Zixibacteria bacterium]
MRILDRYVAKRFLFTMSFALIAFISVFLIVDLIENLDKFIDRDVPADIIVQYYINFIPFIVVLTMPVAVLLSTLFSLGSLARNFELVAMKANGISLYRILSPLLLIGLLISAGIFFIGDDIVSYANRRKAEIKAEHIDRRPDKLKAKTSDLFVEGENGAIYYMRIYDPATKTGSGILIHRIEENRIIETIEAESMKYIETGWVAENGTHRIFDKDSIASADEFKTFDKMVLSEFKEPPEAFEKLNIKPESMTFSELKNHIALKRKLGKDTSRERVELHLKVSFPLINFIIILLGAPLASSPKKSGAALGFAVSLLVSFIYFTIIRACQSLGQNHHLPPVLAAWLANILFFCIGIFLTLKAHK